jgi:pimeloyl-ACP methyl ester carboxylesterase
MSRLKSNAAFVVKVESRSSWKQTFNYRTVEVFMLRLMALTLALTISSTIAAQTPDRSPFVRPTLQGQLVDVGGRNLHIRCTGDNKGPTIIVEAAMGTWSSHYAAMQENIGTFARVCTYDRAGLGWSDPATGGRSIRDMANDLDALLTEAKVISPYVIVGHSLGGLIARQYASMHPSRVAGVVLVESSNELINFTPAYEASRIQRIAMIDSGLKIGKPGVPVMPMPPGSSPEAVMAMLPETLLATKDELTSFERTPASMRLAGGFGTLGDTPLIVVRRGRTAQPPSSDDIAWQLAQAELLKLSTCSKLIVAEKSGHMVPMDEPEIVSTAVKQVLSMPSCRESI